MACPIGVTATAGTSPRNFSVMCIFSGRTQRTGQPFLEVLDHGHGVDPQTADKIFEPFYTDRSGGTGLGLYISRELCELNRASLVFSPRDTGGSIFRIVFADPRRWEGVNY
jgi:two-component system sensor histidine kinase PilS (NtrC family)